MTKEEQQEFFDQYVNNMRDVLLNKGDDYANADRLSNFKMAGQIAGGNAQLNCLNLIATKVARLGVLLNSKDKPKNESINDSIMDLANYALLLAMINYDRKKIYPLDELIFQTTLHYNTINDYIKYWCLENGIRKNITTHIGRHSFGCMWAAMGGNPFHLKEILGHSDIKHTEVYYKIQAADIRISMEQLPKFNFKGLEAV